MGRAVATTLQMTRDLHPQNTLTSTSSMAIPTAADGPATVTRRHNNTNGGFGCLGAVGMAVYAAADCIILQQRRFAIIHHPSCINMHT